jgi:hypothetical protein
VGKVHLGRFAGVVRQSFVDHVGNRRDWDWNSICRVCFVNEGNMKKTPWLRNLLLLDAAILFWLGLLFVLVPKRIEVAFHFPDLPVGVNYLVGLWGCVFLSLGYGYVVAAGDPIRHLVWVQIGIARGLLESLLGLFYLVQGVVSMSQAGFGIFVAALITPMWFCTHAGQKCLTPLSQISRQPVPDERGWIGAIAEADYQSLPRLPCGMCCRGSV